MFKVSERSNVIVDIASSRSAFDMRPLCSRVAWLLGAVTEAWLSRPDVGAPPRWAGEDMGGTWREMSLLALKVGDVRRRVNREAVPCRALGASEKNSVWCVHLRTYKGDQ